MLKPTADIKGLTKSPITPYEVLGRKRPSLLWVLVLFSGYNAGGHMNNL
jgi:hypothetical protein